MPKTLLHVERIRALAIIQPHACPHAIVELANDGEHSRWNAKVSQDSPQESAIDGVVGFGKVDKAHEQRVVILPSQFLQASHHEHHVDRRGVGSKSTLLLREDAFPFAVVTEAARDGFEECFARVSHKGDDTIVTTLRPIFLFV